MTLTRRSSLVLIAALFLLSCAPVQPGPGGVAQAQTATPPPANGSSSPAGPQKPLADMWLDVSIGQPLVDWFNNTARPDDIARADHVSLINLMEEITAGRRLVVFKSAAEAQQALPFVSDRMEIVGYNLEHGPANPLDEQADPISGVKLMRELADRYKLKLAMGPDHDFAVQYGPALAPYVDIFVLQIQRVQTDPATVQSFVVPLAAALRAANPDIQISVQVRTEGDVKQLADLLQSISGSIDGVSILTSPETVSVAEDLVRELRSRTQAPTPMSAQAPRPAQDLVPRAQAAELPTATAAAEAPSTPTPTITSMPLPTATPTMPALAGAAAAANRPTPAASAAAPALVPGAFRSLLLPLAAVMGVAAVVGGIVGALAVLFLHRGHKQ